MSRREPKVRRIVVTLEPDSVDTRLVQNAARLARAYDAELVGLFVKVQELLDLAELPFSRTVVSTTGTIQQLDRGHMDSALDQLARKARRQLSEQAERHQVQWSFQTQTGHCEEVVAGIATANDLVALAPGPAGSLQHPPAITVTHAALARAQSVTVMYEGDASLLAVAHRFADSLSAPLTIMIAAADATERARLQRNVSPQFLR